ncbi:hypothetical protein EAE96_007659 [Botrytis aclada]|nr:hypothetical protein EAE96_007659 [Botrytis aclada]
MSSEEVRERKGERVNNLNNKTISITRKSSLYPHKAQTSPLLKILQVERRSFEKHCMCHRTTVDTNIVSPFLNYACERGKNKSMNATLQLKKWARVRIFNHGLDLALSFFPSPFTSPPQPPTLFHLIPYLPESPISHLQTHREEYELLAAELHKQVKATEQQVS